MPTPEELETGRRFGERAEQYDAERRHVWRDRVRERVLEVVAGAGARTVLDIGCGTGLLLRSCASAIERGVGVDVSEGMLAVARREAAGCGAGNLEFRQVSYGDLPGALEGERFDAVLTTYALHHLKDPGKRRAIGSMAELVAPGGRLIVGDLMWFGDGPVPDEHDPVVGFDPSCDYPSMGSFLGECMAESGLEPTLERLVDLVGVCVGRRGERGG